MLVISCELLLGELGVRFVVLVVCFGRECCCFGWFGAWGWCVVAGGLLVLMRFDGMVDLVALAG